MHESPDWQQLCEDFGRLEQAVVTVLQQAGTASDEGMALLIRAPSNTKDRQALSPMLASCAAVAMARVDGGSVARFLTANIPNARPERGIRIQL